MPDESSDTDNVEATDDDTSDDDASDADATKADATNSKPAAETSTYSPAENNDVAPVVVHVEADSTKMPMGVLATNPNLKPVGN